MDTLAVTSNAAGLSAFNPNEHLWSSRFREDHIPPYLDTTLTNEEKEEQSMPILDMGANAIAAYWAGAEYPVVLIPVSSNSPPKNVQTADDIVALISDFGNNS